MSEDVVKQLREIRWRADLMHEAADCIERLEANYIEACDEAAECYMRQCIAERKLAKAVEALPELHAALDTLLNSFPTKARPEWVADTERHIDAVIAVLAESEEKE